MARSELESSMKSIKYILLIITVMFIVVSALMLTLGVSVYSRYHDFRFILSLSQHSYLAPSVLVTLTGACMLLVTLFGFVGTLRESTCLVNTYALILSGLLVLQVAVIAIGFGTDEQHLASYVTVPVAEYAADPEIRDEIDFMQNSLKCCGASSFYDYAALELSGPHTVLANLTDASLVIPRTCCYRYAAGAGSGHCEAAWASGCEAAVVALVMQNAGVLGVLAMSVAFIQLLGIIFSVLLGKTIRRVKSERAYLRWKVMEQTIAARAENAKAQPFVYIQRPDSTKA